MYIYQRSGWPKFTWDEKKVSTCLLPAKFEQGRLLGSMQHLGFSMREMAELKVLTTEVIKTSEIEGEKLDMDQVRSSIARHLGLNVAGLVNSDRDVDGIVTMLLDATKFYDKALTQERMLQWHMSMFPRGMSDMSFIHVGMWRSDVEGPMQVVSGYYGRQKVHFEAPAARIINKEMTRFIKWFNQNQAEDLFVKAAIAHLWFVTLHPFDDGNGRMARALTEMLLAKADDQSQRFYSMSAQIRRERKEYYLTLEKTQKGALDITEWLCWFLQCLTRSMQASESLLKFVLDKSRCFEKFSNVSFNARQITMLNYLFDGFKGHLTSSKWAKMAKCSQDTAIRDIQDLINKKVFKQAKASGRNTHYLLKGFSINTVE